MTRKISEEVIAEAAHRLHIAAPEATIILFGSHARGDNHEDSDLDFLVVEPNVHSRHQEMVRLRDVLRDLRIPVDVLVVDADAYMEWGDVPGTIFHEVRQEGKSLYGAA